MMKIKYTILLLMLIAAVPKAWAEATVSILSSVNGTVTYEKSGSTVTLTVTPDENYFLHESDLKVRMSVDGGNADARTRTGVDPGLTDYLTVTNNHDGTFTFTLPDKDYEYVAHVTAVFRPVTVELSAKSFTYNAAVQKPTLTVTFDGTTPLTTSDYVATYSGNSKDAGDYTITITGQGGYVGTTSAFPFIIAPKLLTITAKNDSVGRNASITTAATAAGRLERVIWDEEALVSGEKLVGVDLHGDTSHGNHIGGIIPSNAIIKNSNGTGDEVQSNYEITYVEGDLKVLYLRYIAEFSDDKRTMTFKGSDDDLVPGKTIDTSDLHADNYNSPFGGYDRMIYVNNVIFDLSYKDARPKSTKNWFNNAQYLTTINHIDYLNTESVTNMHGMFYYCRNLTSLDVSRFSTSNVTDMAYMFYNCEKITSLDVSKFNTAKVTNMTFMFAFNTSLTSLDVTHFNTNNVTDMGMMFYACEKLTSLDVTHFNTEKVTNMKDMFYDCKLLTSLDVSSFNTTNVTNMNEMFSECRGLTSLDVSNFDTSNVTDMGSMFNSCTNLSSLDLSNFDTSNVTNMGNMFYECQELTSINLNNFNTSKVINIHAMFFNCQKLRSLNLSNLNTSKVSHNDEEYYSGSMGYLFYNCVMLEELNLSTFDTDSINNMDYMFYNCQKLKKLYISEAFNTEAVAHNSYMFYGVSSFTDLIVIGDTVPHIKQENLFEFTSGYELKPTLTVLKRDGTTPSDMLDSLIVKNLTDGSVTWKGGTFCSLNGRKAFKMSVHDMALSWGYGDTWAEPTLTLQYPGESETQTPKSSPTYAYKVKDSADDNYVSYTYSTETMPIVLPVGNYTIKVTLPATTEYMETKDSVDFTIIPRVVVFDWSNKEFDYDGTNKAPTAVVSNLVGDDECIVTVSDSAFAVGVHTATATALSNPNYALPEDKSQSFTITPRPVTLTWSDTGTGETKLIYNGSAQKPTATAGNLVEGDECTVTVTGEQTNAGDHTATASALSNSNYKLPDDVTQGFTITPKAIGDGTATPAANITLTGIDESYVYTGSAIEPVVTLTYDQLPGSDKTISATSNYAVVYTDDDHDNLTVAKGGIVTITGEGNYTGSIVKTFDITPKPFSTTAITIAEIPHQAYNGTELTPAVTLHDVARDVDLDVADFTVTKHKDAGTHTVTITAQGNYQAELTAPFTIDPKTVELAWSNLVFDYDGTDKLASAEVSNLEGEDECAVTVTGSASAVGVHTATATALDNTNYQLPTDDADKQTTFEILKIFSYGANKTWMTFFDGAEDLEFKDGEEDKIETYVVTEASGSTVTVVNTGGKIYQNVPMLLKRTGEETIIRAHKAESLAALSATPFENFYGGVTDLTNYKNVYVLVGSEFLPTTGTTIDAERCFLALGGMVTAPTRMVIVVDNETTGLTPCPIPMVEGSYWYTLDGRKLSGIPAKKGMYIWNGKKVVIK